MTSYLYFGGPGSSFAWHLEDRDCNSISLMHLGMPKVWYVIPPAYGRRFEDSFVHAKDACKHHMRHKRTAIDPELIRGKGIPVYEAVHNPRQFIITFQFAYHSGYNRGYNVAEAVNFGYESWVKFAMAADRCSTPKRCGVEQPKFDIKKLAAIYEPGT